jgi:hypothetical protein
MVLYIKNSIDFFKSKQLAHLVLYTIVNTCAKKWQKNLDFQNCTLGVELGKKTGQQKQG